MPHGKRIAELLLDIGAVKLSLDPPFTWTSGIKSPIYCDNRMILSHPKARNFVVEALAERVRSLQVEPDYIGAEGGAIPWGALVAGRLELPFVYLRKKAKEHGLKKRMEGDLPPEKDLVVIEDLISTGGSSVDTAEAFRDEGQANVSDVVAIFSYELMASRDKAQEGRLGFHPVSTLTALLEVAVEQGRIPEEDVARVAKFAEDPKKWGA